MSGKRESLKAVSAGGRPVEVHAGDSTLLRRDTIDYDPIVSSLLSGTKNLGKELEDLVRDESALQGIALPRESNRTLSYARFTKPLLDKLFAALALLFFLPVFLLVAIAIKATSQGPIFFVQQRTGYLGRRFALYKFRTMVVNAEELKKELMDRNIFDEGSPDFKLKNDPRITRIGAFLRKTSIDELPNLINVLRGDMSLVGPRPTSFKATTYRKSHLPRLAATPGLTGLWQVSGRADVDFDERSELDTHYIRNLSFKTDLHISCKTIGVVFYRRGAY